MKNWKVIINYLGNILEISLEAKSFSDAYIKVENKHPGCSIRSISEIRSKKTKHKMIPAENQYHLQNTERFKNVFSIIFSLFIYFTNTAFSQDNVEKKYGKNGNIISETPYSNGIINGIVKYFYPNGTLQFEAQYTDGKINGNVRYYYSKGVVLYESTYANGKKNGILKYYDEKGQLVSETPYTDDKKNGWVKYYDKDGKLISETLYENDRIVPSQK